MLILRQKQLKWDVMSKMFQQFPFCYKNSSITVWKTTCAKNHYSDFGIIIIIMIVGKIILQNR
jgi:hypothetical protein